MQSNLSIPIPKPTSRRRLRSALSLALAVACLGSSAVPASAGNEFEDGFEDQLGRLLAFEALRFGRIALFGVPYAHGYESVSQRRERHHDDDWNRYGERDRYDRKYRTIALHYHRGSDRPCNLVHDVHVHRKDRHLRHWERERQRAYRRWRQQQHRHH